MQNTKQMNSAICFFVLTFLFSTAVYAYEQGIVIFDNSTLRIAPDNAATVILTLNQGDIVRITDDKIHDWYQLDNHLYIRKGYVQLKTTITPMTYVLLSENVMRTEDGVIPLSTGDKIQILGYENGIIYAEFLGIIGYIDQLDESFPNDYELKSLIVQEALNYIGYPYQYGGNSLLTGTDCSGFVQLVYKKFGINLERSSSMQYLLNGYFIDETDIQKGDLIFYGDNNQISHVAMYIGNGQIAHAASEKQGICISNMNLNMPILGIKRI